MKNLFFISALLIVLSACGTAPTAPTEVPLPVVLVDSQHMLTPNLAYEIPAGPGFVLDASSHNFGTAVGPSAVQIVLSGRFYQAAWLSGATRMPILAADLKPVTGTTGLAVFSSGQQMIVAIGSISDKGQFNPLWVAVVNVK
jgi:hypothetical protein